METKQRRKIEIRKNFRVAEIVDGERIESVTTFNLPKPGDLPNGVSPESPVSGFVFGSAGKNPAEVAESPLISLLGDGAPSDSGIHAAQICAVSGVPSKPVTLNGRTVGFAYEDDCAAYCRLRGITSNDASMSPGEQTSSAFENVKSALESAGFAFRDVVRTWCYLDNLLDWYGEFNSARNAFFEREGVYEGVVPASTGIGASNAAGAALVLDVLATRPRAGGGRVAPVESPMQNPALDYKSSFSRAVEIACPGYAMLMVSGTASIDGDGRSVRIGDLDGQIELTLDVVEALLESRGMSWCDAFRGIAYFKHPEDVGELGPRLARRGIPEFPLAAVPAAVCRDELLFELELDAANAV
jgi:enamine deaminase RidA (YjgF/YER057c/UK114 family)